MAGETFEVEEMYAVYLEVAELQEEKGARQGMWYAIEAEKAAQANQEIKIPEVYICPVCGLPISANRPTVVQCEKPRTGHLKPFRARSQVARS